MTTPDNQISTFDELCDVMQTRQSAMPKRLVQTATYMLNHPDEVAFGTSGSVASAAGVQPSTVVRFAQSVGLSGFSDLQRIFRTRLRDRTLSYETRLEAIGEQGGEADENAMLLNGFLTAARNSLDVFQQEIDPVVYGDAVTTLARARTLYLIARRRSFAPIIQMQYAMAKLGLRHQMVSAINGVEAEIAAMAEPIDAAIIISFHPYAEQTIECAERLHTSGVPIVAITDSAMSPLHRTARHIFLVTEADFAGFRAMSVSMTLATAIPVSVARRRRDWQAGQAAP